MKAQINFYNPNDYDIKLGKDIKSWLSQVIKEHNFKYSEINYTFVSDDELLEINRTYLNHDFYTDIITFDNTINETISADIMISLDRVKDNAKHQQVAFEDELYRVMAHGVLHCMGFTDNDENAKQEMRRKEDEAIKMFHVEQNRKLNNV